MKTIKNKSGQEIKSAETIMVLFVFIILVMFGLTFYVKLSASSAQQEKSDSTLKKAVEISQIFSNLPEVACTAANVRTESCIDRIKMETAMTIINESITYYYPYFGYSEIIVSEIYPDKLSWVLYNNSLESASKISSQIPIAIYDGTTKSHYYGVMEVNYYEK